VTFDRHGGTADLSAPLRQPTKAPGRRSRTGATQWDCHAGLKHTSATADSVAWLLSGAS
jgi:hypothetical protein